MTGTTNTIILDTGDEITEQSGVMYAERGTDPDTGQSGVVLQYIMQHGEVDPDVEFFPNSEIVGVYDDVTDDYLSEEFRQHIE